MPSLLAKEGPLAGQRLQVDSTLTLGRGEADIVIDDQEISRRHALMRAGSGFFEIEDLDSLNGTWVNGLRIDQTERLRPGDLIRLGKTVLEVEAAAPQAAAPVAADPDRPAAAVATLDESRCSECGAELPSQSRFCLYCGVALRRDQDRDAAPPPAAVSLPGLEPSFPVAPAPGTQDELRPVTALFADVVGSTALGERLAPDEVKELIGECVSRITRVVEQYGGTVQSYMGDGIAAFFGLPAAHEDDPERAAHAALRILEVVAEYAVDIRAAWQVRDFNVRVGVNSGQAAVGVVGGANLQTVALGDTSNVAARLQSSAVPGTAVVGEATARRLAHRFLLESLGDVAVKGRTKPVAVWRLVRFQNEARTPAPTPLVGRETEVARLRIALDELHAGRGQSLLLVGDAGFGKSRLLSELQTLVDDRMVWLEGHCRSFGGELLYWPFVEALRGWIGVEPGEAEVSVRTKLRARLASLGGLDHTQVLPGLASLLSIRVDARAAGTPSEPGVDGRPDEASRAFCSWIEALCSQSPVVLAVDDLHWADPRTRDLAEALLEVTDRAPLLLATAFRAEPAGQGSRFRLHALEHYSHRVVDLTLGPLSDLAAAELLGMLMPEGLEETARRELIARAEGNPLYLEELLRSLIEEGGLERRHRTWALTIVPGATLPPALEALLMARIDHLPEEARRLAQIAAVVGRAFPAQVLTRVSGSDDLGAELSVLMRAQFIRELHRYPQLVYTFKHGLLQEAALSTLTPARRQELFGRVAAAFEEIYAASRDEYLELLASYYARSQNLPKACEYLERAGARAASLNATAQAVDFWTKASAIATRLGDETSAQRLAGRLEELR